MKWSEPYDKWNSSPITIKITFKIYQSLSLSSELFYSFSFVMETVGLYKTSDSLLEEPAAHGLRPSCWKLGHYLQRHREWASCLGCFASLDTITSHWFLLSSKKVGSLMICITKHSITASQAKYRIAVYKADNWKNSSFHLQLNLTIFLSTVLRAWFLIQNIFKTQNLNSISSWCKRKKK